jgi:N-acetylglucosaminyldiphosphoundecaprenol N-acetyl-beta-D-mannosaminyltransferase
VPANSSDLPGLRAARRLEEGMAPGRAELRRARGRAPALAGRADLLGPRVVAGVELERIVLGGTPCDLVGHDELLQLVRTALGRAGDPVLIASANLDHLTRFGPRGPHPGLFTASPHRERWVVTLDGAPLVARARKLTGSPWPQLAGSDVLPALIDVAGDVGASFGVVGGSEATHERLHAVLATRWPDLHVAGMWAPPPEVLAAAGSRRALAEEVGAAEVGLLAVCLGKPKQELWLDEFADVIRPRVGVCFGAAVDFLAGSARRAPAVVRRVHAEWAWRLVAEPRRLWQRYLVEGPPAYRALRRESTAMPRPERPDDDAGATSTR